jgi:hypothetical protein
MQRKKYKITGDEYIIPGGTWDEKSQVAIEAALPLPANVGAVIFWYVEGDTSG